MRLPFSMMLEDREPLTVLASTAEDGGKASTGRGLRFKATVWREGPNRNHVYLNPNELEAFAASFKGQPFLADHSHKLSDRGGTVLSAELVPTEKGRAITATIDAKKPWAVEGVMDGTVDRFSIGWNAEKYDCTVCETDFFDEDHRHSVFDVGTKDKKTGKTVGVLMSGLEGIEISAVTHPAVPGTSTDEVMSQLKVASESRASGSSAIRPTPGVAAILEETMREKVLALLGLPADTGETEALAAAEQRLKAPASVPAVLLSALGLSAEATTDQAVARAYTLVPREDLEKERAKVADSRAADLVRRGKEAGKITPVMEAWANEFARRNPDEFERCLSNMPVQVPTAPPPITTDPKKDESSSEDEDWARMTGLSLEQLKAGREAHLRVLKGGK